jgi:hypothetical protein
MDEFIGRLVAKIGVDRAAAADAAAVVARFQHRNTEQAFARKQRASIVADAADSNLAGMAGEAGEYAYEQAGRNAVGVFVGAIPGFGQSV